MFKSAVGAVLGSALALAGCQPQTLTEADVARFEAQLVLPEGAEPLSSYARYYAPPRVHTEDSLPFTSMAPLPGWREPRSEPVVVGVLAQPGVWGDHPPGAHIVRERELPNAVHGGCRSVNVVFEPRSGRTLGVWCNIDETTARPDPEN